MVVLHIYATYQTYISYGYENLPPDMYKHRPVKRANVHPIRLQEHVQVIHVLTHLNMCTCTKCTSDNLKI